MFRFHREMFHGWPESALCLPVKSYHGNESRCVVVGDLFGPDLFCVGEDEQDAVEEWYSRHGYKIEPGEDFSDFDGETIEERFEHAMNSGAIACVNGSPDYWTDDYLWSREFATLRDAVRHYRNR